MMKTKNITKYLFAGIAALCVAGTAMAQADNYVLDAMRNEVDRNMKGLRIDKLQPPFFISYTVADIRQMDVGASLGALVNSNDVCYRIGSPFVLAGDYMHNNSNFGEFTGFYNQSPFSIEKAQVGIANNIWNDLDALYKNAAERLESKQAMLRQQKQPEEEANLPDFERREPVTLLMDPLKMKIDIKYWEDYVKKASEVARKYPDIINSRVNASAREVTMHYYNTEQSSYRVPSFACSIQLTVSAMTDDGQEINDEVIIAEPSFEQLPSLEIFTAQCERFIEDFLALREAPLIDDAYCGPVMFEGEAVAKMVQQFFFLSRSLVAQRKPVTPGGYGSSNPLEMMMNKKIISRSLTIESLSGTEHYNGRKLAGYFPIDAQAVAPDKRLTLVEDGVLRKMLNGRIPTPKMGGSNGHMRLEVNFRMPQIAPGNVRLSSSETYTKEQLRQMLIDAAKEEDLDYGYIVRRSDGSGVVAIYRVYIADGREELVRGAQIADLNMRSFKRVLGASDKEIIYNSSAMGNLASYIVPDALLFEELEVARNSSLNLKTPYIVDRPEVADK